MELLLALFFGIESVMDCWKHWNHRQRNYTMENGDDDLYYMYDDDSEISYSMLQQQSDIWINVLAYTYMTYHTYHEYYKARINHRDIQRSFSSTLLNHQHFQQQSLQQQQQQEAAAARPAFPQQHFPRTQDKRHTTTVQTTDAPSPIPEQSATTSSSEDESVVVDYTATIQPNASDPVTQGERSDNQ